MVGDRAESFSLKLPELLVDLRVFDLGAGGGELRLLLSRDEVELKKDLPGDGVLGGTSNLAVSFESSEAVLSVENAESLSEGLENFERKDPFEMLLLSVLVKFEKGLLLEKSCEDPKSRTAGGQSSRNKVDSGSQSRLTFLTSSSSSSESSENLEVHSESSVLPASSSSSNSITSSMWTDFC